MINQIKSDWIWLNLILKIKFNSENEAWMLVSQSKDWFWLSCILFITLQIYSSELVKVIFTTNQVNTAFWDNFNLALHCVVWSTTEMALNLNWKITLPELYIKMPCIDFDSRNPRSSVTQRAKITEKVQKPPFK